MHTLKDGKFTEKLPATLGLETIDVPIRFKLTDNEHSVATRDLKLRICDTAGEEADSGLSKSYFRGASAIISICSLDQEGSVNNIDELFYGIRNSSNADKIDSGAIKVFHVLNKCDLKPTEEEDDEEKNAILSTFWNFGET